jgi:hypothetical protein
VIATGGMPGWQIALIAAPPVVLTRSGRPCWAAVLLAVVRVPAHLWRKTMDLVFSDDRPLAGGTPGLELRLLGPVQEARAGREVALGGPKQRAVLVLLLLDAGQVIPAGHLAQQLWRGSPPPGAATTLRSYLSRLRALLSPEAELAARGGGYAISIGTAQLDAPRFERLATAGQAAGRPPAQPALGLPCMASRPRRSARARGHARLRWARATWLSARLGRGR